MNGFLSFWLPILIGVFAREIVRVAYHAGAVIAFTCRDTFYLFRYYWHKGRMLNKGTSKWQLLKLPLIPLAIARDHIDARLYGYSVSLAWSFVDRPTQT